MKKNNSVDIFERALSLLYNKKEEDLFSLINEIEDEITNVNGRSLLHYAIFEKKLNLLEELLRKGYDVNSKDSDGWTPLHYAVQDNRVDFVNLLLKYKADINAKDGYGNTVIARATFSAEGNGDIIRLLIDKGADPKIPNDSGVSAIDLAKRIGNYDLLQFF